MSIFKYLRNLTLKTAPCPRFGPSFGFVSFVSSAPSPPLTQSCPIASAGCRTWWSCCRWWGWGGRWRGRRRWRRSSRAPCPSRWQGWRPRIPPGASASASEIALHVPSIMIKCTLIRAARRHSFSNDSKSPNSSFSKLQSWHVISCRVPPDYPWENSARNEKRMKNKTENVEKRVEQGCEWMRCCHA